MPSSLAEARCWLSCPGVSRVRLTTSCPALASRLEQGLQPRQRQRQRQRCYLCQGQLRGSHQPQLGLAQQPQQGRVPQQQRQLEQPVWEQAPSRQHK